MPRLVWLLGENVNELVAQIQLKFGVLGVIEKGRKSEIPECEDPFHNPVPLLDGCFKKWFWFQTNLPITTGVENARHGAGQDNKKWNK